MVQTFADMKLSIFGKHGNFILYTMNGRETRTVLQFIHTQGPMNNEKRNHLFVDILLFLPRILTYDV